MLPLAKAIAAFASLFASIRSHISGEPYVSVIKGSTQTDHCTFAIASFSDQFFFDPSAFEYDINPVIHRPFLVTNVPVGDENAHHSDRPSAINIQEYFSMHPVEHAHVGYKTLPEAFDQLSDEIPRSARSQQTPECSTLASTPEQTLLLTPVLVTTQTAGSLDKDSSQIDQNLSPSPISPALLEIVDTCFACNKCGSAFRRQCDLK